jgi:hypothetical protein
MGREHRHGAATHSHSPWPGPWPRPRSLRLSEPPSRPSALRCRQPGLWRALRRERRDRGNFSFWLTLGGVVRRASCAAQTNRPFREHRRPSRALSEQRRPPSWRRHRRARLSCKQERAAGQLVTRKLEGGGAPWWADRHRRRRCRRRSCVRPASSSTPGLGLGEW